MKIVEHVLLCQRSDGKYLKLNCGRHATSWEFVDDPLLATRETPYFKDQLANPKPATYYFENSERARELWTKDCVMVPFEFVTVVEARRLDL